MKKILTELKGLFIIENPVFYDIRGSFKKPFSRNDFETLEIDNSEFEELYYSVNKKDVLRGMHFQTPPFAHDKLVYVSKGIILDVVLDLRKGSGTFGKYFSIELDDENGLSLYIPKGIAHGFLSKEEGSIVNYAQTSCHAKENDFGIRFDSFGFDWGIAAPIVSDRDRAFPGIAGYETAFK